MVEVDLSGGLGAGLRRRRSAAERRRVVEETLEAGASVAKVALKYGVNANQVFQWRRLYRDGKLGAASSNAMKLLPVSVVEVEEIPRPEPARFILSFRERSGSASKAASIRIWCVPCSRVFVRDLASGRNPDLDRGGRDGHASRLSWSQRPGADSA